MTDTIKWVPVPDLVTIEELYKKAGFTRVMFTGKGPELHNALCLGEKDGTTMTSGTASLIIIVVNTLREDA